MEVNVKCKLHIKAIRILLKFCAEFNIPPDVHNRHALQAATVNENVDLVQVLLKAGAEVDAISETDEFNETALSKAVGVNNVELVCILVTAGANVDGCRFVWQNVPFSTIRCILSIAYSAIEYSVRINCIRSC